jgi:hypothetical protein
VEHSTAHATDEKGTLIRGAFFVAAATVLNGFAAEVKAGSSR